MSKSMRLQSVINVVVLCLIISVAFLYWSLTHFKSQNSVSIRNTYSSSNEKTILNTTRDNNNLPELHKSEILLWNNTRLNYTDNIPSIATVRLLHVINPFYSTSNKSLDSQKLTMTSLESARSWSQLHVPDLHVTIMTIENDGDNAQLFRPSTFYKSPMRLQRSSLEFMQQEAEYVQMRSNNSNSRMDMPLLKDVLISALNTAKQSAFTHVIYTNMDIAVTPQFYLTVMELTRCYSSFMINRVEIPEAIVEDLSSFHLHPPEYSYTQPIEYITSYNLGVAYRYARQFKQLHPGYDCMVVRIDLLEKVINGVGNVFIGFPPVGSVLVEAMKKADTDCVVLKGMHTTFHVGSRNGGWGEDEGTVEIVKLNTRLSKIRDVGGGSSAMNRASVDTVEKGVKSRRGVSKKCRVIDVMKSKKHTQCFRNDRIAEYLPMLKDQDTYMFQRDFK